MFRAHAHPLTLLEVGTLLTNHFPCGNAILPVRPGEIELLVQWPRAAFLAGMLLLVVPLMVHGVRSLWRQRPGRFAVAAFLVPILLLVLHTVAEQIVRRDWPRYAYLERNLFFVLGFFGLVTLAGAATMTSRAARLLCVSALLGVNAAGVVLMQTRWSQTWTVYKPNGDWRAAAAFFAHEAAARGTPPIIFETAPIDAMFYYYGDRGPRRVIPRGPVDGSRLARALKDESAETFFLVSDPHWAPAAPGAGLKLVRHVEFAGVDVYELALDGEPVESLEARD